jgi:holliday junction DNA helicase RuvB
LGRRVHRDPSRTNKEPVKEKATVHTEVNSVRPTSLNHLVGNQAVIRQVRVALDASQQDAVKFPSALLLGGAGQGKSTLASVIAQEMASPFHEVLGQNIQKPSDLTALLLKATDRSVVHIDEAHELKKEIMTLLYTCLDQSVLKVPGGGAVESIPLADFTLLLSTTDEYALLPPLVSRMKLSLHLEYYTETDLQRIVSTRARELGWRLDEAILPLIAQRSRSTARRSLNILQSSRRVCRSEGEDFITMEHFTKATQIDGIDSAGLEKRDRTYLRLLLEKPMKVNVLSSSLGTPIKTLTTHIEPPLIRLGWVTKDEQGRRVIAEKARKHLQEIGDE